jgi:DNA-binding beta-propeller fold protein YncE
MGDGEIKIPADLVLDQNQRLYVVDSGNKEVRVFNPDGTNALTIGTEGTGDGQFTWPVAVALQYRLVDGIETGELYVADKESSRIQVFDLQGNFLRAFGEPMPKTYFGSLKWKGFFFSIQAMDFDQYGMLHVLDSAQNKVQILDPLTGAYQDYYDAFINDRAMQLQFDIDIDAGGRVIMTNTSYHTVELIHTVP